MDWLLKPLAVAIISAACFEAGFREGASRTQADCDKAEVEAIKQSVVTNYRTKALEDNIEQLKQTCR